jgi:signal transduction histidine kinase
MRGGRASQLDDVAGDRVPPLHDPTTAVPSELAKERFVGRTIPVVIAAFALAFAGVLLVDLFIEHRQIEGSTHVAASTISTMRTAAEFGKALHRFHDAAVSGVPDGLALPTLQTAQSKLDATMQDFEEHLGAEDRPAWRELRGRIAALEGPTPLQQGTPAAALDGRVRAIEDDLSAAMVTVERQGLAALRNAQRLHTFEGALEGGVLVLLAAASVALLFGWRRAEARARSRDARIEEQLRRTLEDLDGFAGRVAHDLRSPLTPILAGSQWIEKAPVTDAVRVHAERIERSARRLGRMIDALLQYTRAPAEGGGEGVSTPVSAVVGEIVADFDELARARGARLETDLGPDATLACGPEILQSIVANLVDNALKYGGREGQPPRVTVRTRLEPPFCAIEVEDAGRGIPPELRERVFQPLFRGEKGGAGVGLGLSIVQRLVEAHGGRVVLVAGAAGGALFRVLLPLAEAASRGEARPGGAEAHVT